MSYEIEYESRIMLTKEEYDRLFLYYISKGTVSYLTNYYLDTKSFDIRKTHSVLRIRNINDSDNELTLKVKGENGDQEFTQSISQSEVDNILAGKPIPAGIVYDETCKIANIKEIESWGFIKVKRLEINIDNAIIAIDFCTFKNAIDYNLEVESTSLNESEKILNKLIQEFHISLKDCYVSKSSRAYKYYFNN